MDENVKRILELQNALHRLNEKAVELRDQIGTGSAVAELRARVQNLVEMSRKPFDYDR